MKRIIAILTACLMICFVFTSCAKEYQGDYVYENVADLGENAQNSTEVEVGYTLSLSGTSFKMELTSGEAVTTIKGSIEEREDNKIALIQEKKTAVDEDGVKAKEEVENAEEWIFIYKDGKLVSESGDLTFVKID